MSTPSPGLLNAIANFLEVSRDYLDVECPIRLAWPRSVSQPYFPLPLKPAVMPCRAVR